MIDKIIIRGAREHNLRNINLELPRNKLIVFTGISGSGKSTLAFDTIFAEGQRRYLESLSSYARQFLGRMNKPDVDYIEGLSPSISIDQKSASHNPRSTVGTVTEIQDYLRLLYARIGVPHCPICDREISKLSTDEIADRILEFPEGTKIEILSPIVRQRKGEYTTLIVEMFKRGFSKAYINGKKYDIHPASKEAPKLARYKKHDIDIVVDETVINEENVSRIFDDVERALKLSGGIVKINFQFLASNIKRKSSNKKNNNKIKSIIFNQNLACPVHDIEFPELEPRLFSFNSPYGACPDCEGLGTKKEIDTDMIIPDKNKTIAEGGILPWSYKRNNYQSAVLRAVVRYYHIPDNMRIRDLAEEKIKLLLNGRGADEELDEILVSLRSAHGSTWKFHVEWKGVIALLKERYLKTESESVREDVEKYMSESHCSTCGGSRYKQEALLVTVHGKNIHEISSISIAKALKFFSDLSLTQKEKLIAERIQGEIHKRLQFLDDVGLGYLTLGRSAQTLAGGETQRIRLASQIGSQLVGVLYSPGRFSFNVKGGRCENCDGEGFLKIEMQFMPDVYLPCDVCEGKRYNRETLQVKYKGKNIAEVLAMMVSEAKDFFESFAEIHDKLKIMEDVGLGYINLGQSATTLSGGEAQRIKLSTELSRKATGNTLYILDEPTTGLHFDDIKKLLHVLNRLVDAGNSVVVIEHNMDVIKTADWIIDLGPEGGEGGGRVVVVGTPEEVAKHEKESYTGKYLKEVLSESFIRT